jgi:hypothetical protein
MVQSRPSDCWNGQEKLKSISGRWYEQIHRVLDSAEFRYLEHQALAARKLVETDLDVAIECCIDPTVFSYGSNSVVFEVAFSDNVYWVAKVQHAATRDSDVVYMLSEIATMKLVQERTKIPVPRVFGHQARSSDDFKFPFILMEFLPGRDVGRPLARGVPAVYLPKVAKQLADVLFQLENELSFKEIGIIWRGTDYAGPAKIISLPSKNHEYDLNRLPSTHSDSPKTSLEWFYNHRQKENREVMDKHPNNSEWNTACWVLTDAISHIIVEDRVHGPFPLCHMDFHHGNLLFDEEYNLTGVLDWRYAQTVPLERLALSPEFRAGPLIPDEQKKSVARFLSLMRASLQDSQREAARVERLGSNILAGPTSDGSRDDKSEAEAESEDGVDAGDFQHAQQTTLADIFGTKQAEIAGRCILGNPRVALWFGRMVQELIFGEHISWEQMVLALGEKMLN